MDKTAMYEHDRYFIGCPSDDDMWEIGDRQNGSNQVATCTSKAKAVRVWRALIAADDKDAAAGTLAELECADLRDALAHNENASLESESEIFRLGDELARLQSLVDDLHAARYNGGRVPVKEEPKQARKRKARA